MALLESAAYPPAASLRAGLRGRTRRHQGAHAVPFRRQSGANVLMVGQEEESAIAIFASMVASIAAQQKPGDALFYLMDGSPHDSRYFGLLDASRRRSRIRPRWSAGEKCPKPSMNWRQLMAQRQGDDAHASAGPAVYLLLFGLQRYRLLRHQEDDFSFSRGEEEAAPKPDKQFAELLSEGPAAWACTASSGPTRRSRWSGPWTVARCASSTTASCSR